MRWDELFMSALPLCRELMLPCSSSVFCRPCSIKRSMVGEVGNTVFRGALSDPERDRRAPPQRLPPTPTPPVAQTHLPEPVQRPQHQPGQRSGHGRVLDKGRGEAQRRYSKQVHGQVAERAQRGTLEAVRRYGASHISQGEGRLCCGHARHHDSFAVLPKPPLRGWLHAGLLLPALPHFLKIVRQLVCVMHAH